MGLREVFLIIGFLIAAGIVFLSYQAITGGGLMETIIEIGRNAGLSLKEGAGEACNLWCPW
ncbi:MAG: hypothetical protein SVQ76_01265 [Candidatus Nanohaloarchaea archaeon]|nr:hypothetical protein [Candidatus Nanohaloarchaea archaeon]